MVAKWDEDPAKGVCNGCQTLFGDIDKNYGDDMAEWRRLRQRYRTLNVLKVYTYNGERLCKRCKEERVRENEAWGRQLKPRPFFMSNVVANV